jgi:dienelactone hydrolase
MRKCLPKFRSVLVFLALLPALSVLVLGGVYPQANLRSAPALRPELHWLAAGPFIASGENALFADFLGGEDRAQPTTGNVADRKSGARWFKTEPSESGVINFGIVAKGPVRNAAYAYTEIPSARDRFVVMTLGTGPEVQLRLNGGIVFESRLSRKPESDRDAIVLHLRKGTNRLLVKAVGAGDWKLQCSLHEPRGKIFVHQSATIVPDFRAGERMPGAWAQVEVANASGGMLKGMTVELLGDDVVLPSLSETVVFAEGEVKRIPVWVTGHSATPERWSAPLRFRVAAGGKEIPIELAPRVRRPDEYFVTTYRSFVDGSVQPFSVLLPRSFESGRVYPLLLLLHGAHVTGWGQNIISYDPKDWAIQVAVHDRGNNRYRDIGEVDIDEVLAEVKRRYSIDSDRVFLAGHSMGGYGAWYQATHRPDLWAGVSTQAGYSDFFLYSTTGGHSEKLPETDFQKRLFEGWSPLLFAENLLHVPIYIVHGAKDDNVVVEHSRKMAARLKGLGYDFVYDENPEGGHWWGPRGKDFGVDVVDKPAIWAFLRTHDRRTTAPRRVIFKTDTLRYRKAYWISIDEMDDANRFARIEAEVKNGNRIDVTLSNIAKITLRLDQNVVDPQNPVAVYINGAAAFVGPLPSSKNLVLQRGEGTFRQVLPEADLRIADESAAARLGRMAVEVGKTGSPERVIALPPELLKKTEEVYGPAADAFTRPFLFVVGSLAGTPKDREMVEASRRAATFQARDWMARAEGSVRIKLDSQVTSEDIATYNLVLFGNASVNSLIKAINAQLPVKFSGGAIGVGGKHFSDPSVGAVVTCPNPLNRDRYVVLVGGNGPSAMQTAARLRLGELPDYVVFDRRTLVSEWTRFVAGGFFDKYWKIRD